MFRFVQERWFLKKANGYIDRCMTTAEQKSIKWTMVASLATMMFSCQGDDYIEANLMYVDSKAIQCEYGGDTLKQTAQALHDNNIEIIGSACGFRTEFAVTAVCGAGTVDINLHKINTEDAQAAKKLGYLPVSDLQTESSLGYRFTDCENRGIFFNE